MAHAKLSPSGADRWMSCPGSVVMCSGMPDTSSTFADEGTAAHLIASECLSQGIPNASTYVGSAVFMWTDLENVERIQICQVGRPYGSGTEYREVPVTKTMADHIQTYLDNVRSCAVIDKDPMPVMVERKVPISTWTGEEGATGTADAITVVMDTVEKELHVHDLKYGMGVEVQAEGNKQLMIYGLGALEDLELLDDFDRIYLHIHQPRVSEEPSVWDITKTDLLMFGVDVQKAAERVREAEAAFDSHYDDQLMAYLVPGDKQCKWCRAKAVCPALRNFVTDAIGADFEDLDTVTERTVGVVSKSDDELALSYTAISLITSWIKAVEDEVRGRLLAGRAVPGYKLVKGRGGARQWADETAAETIIKNMRLKQHEMYSMKLITPPAIEKIFGPKGTAPSKQRWETLQKFITQPEGRPTIAVESDKRPALDNVINDFEQLEN